MSACLVQARVHHAVKRPDLPCKTGGKYQEAVVKLARAGELPDGRTAAKRLGLPFGIIDAARADTSSGVLANIIEAMDSSAGTHGTTAALALHRRGEKGRAMASGSVGMSGALFLYLRTPV